MKSKRNIRFFQLGLHFGTGGDDVAIIQISMVCFCPICAICWPSSSAGINFFQHKHEFTTLLCVMARNCAISKGRVAARLEGCRDDDHEIASAYAKRAAAAALERSDAAEAISAAVESLPSQVDREIVLLWLQGEPLSRIASLLGMPAATARQRWRRLRPALCDALSEDDR